MVLTETLTVLCHWSNHCKFLTNLQILKSWDAPALPTKKLTANRFQFFGIMTNEYLDQISPVGAESQYECRQCKLMVNQILFMGSESMF